MIRAICFISFYLFFFALSAQISGTIRDHETNLPIQNATIYIDGSTTGTTSDKDGHYVITKVSAPCQLIISHISYQVQAELIKKTPINLNIKLKPRLVEIQEFSISNKNERQKNLKTFHRSFFGTDYWGRNAEILNDSVLFFSHVTDSILLEQNDTIVQTTTKQIQSKTFLVSAQEPLWIRLPLLGYKVRVDLVSLSVRRDFIQNVSIGGYQGFFHFIPFEQMSRRDKRVFTNNRRKAYYHSRQHFGKSLFDGKLAENGYKLLMEKTDTSSRNNKDIIYHNSFEECDLSRYLTYQNKGAFLKNMKGKSFAIKYYEKYNQKPLNLEKNTGFKSSRSWIHIVSDTAWFYPSGITPNQDVMFSGYISTKKVGAFLPGDYLPTDKIE